MEAVSVSNVINLMSGDYFTNARKAFGEEGSRALRQLLDNVKLVFDQFNIEAVEGTITIALRVGHTPGIKLAGETTKIVSCPSIRDVADALSSLPNSSNRVVEICPDGAMLVSSTKAPLDLQKIAKTAVVYHYSDRTDRVLSGAYSAVVPKVSPALRSNFSVPTVDSLEEVLERYSREYALHSRCVILEKIWEGGVDGPRLVLKNKPEATMRDSLCQAIGMMMRTASARPEQNTDESKPVDIRIDWFGRRSSTLIEIKWLGRSLAKQQQEKFVRAQTAKKPAKKTQKYTNYSEARAQEGAGQLVDYLERERRKTGATSVNGILVVFDARRKKVKGPLDLLSKEEALHFEDKEITYNPDYTAIREDFSSPWRFFLKPRASHFRSA